MKMSKTLLQQVSQYPIPQHVAIIMDGNGRWAKQRSLPRIRGHQAGVEAVRRVVDTAGHIGISYLTLYAFSTENWRRPNREPQAVLSLIERTLMKEIDELAKNNVIVHFIGSRAELSTRFCKKIERAYERTKHNTGLHLVLAVNYGGRKEIIDGINLLLKKQKENITEEDFHHYLYTKHFPDPELLIRTSGEKRLSNYLLWQSAYSEFWFTDVLWPDFGNEEFLSAIYSYQQRHRRFGGV